MANFLFVHGAFQGGWVWQRVAHCLEQQGHVVHCPTLSGCGYLFASSGLACDYKDFLENRAGYLETVSGCRHPLAAARPNYDLHTYIADMGNYLEIEELEDIVLVGHSYSGMICGALLMQQRERIRQYIAVDAVIPEAERSFVDIAGAQLAKMLDQHTLDDVLIRPWPVPVFGVGEQQAVWFQSRLRSFPRAGFTTPFPGPFDPAIRPITHITCLRTMSPFIRAMAEKAGALGWPIREMDAGHCPMITCPETLAPLLSSIAQQECAE